MAERASAKKKRPGAAAKPRRGAQHRRATPQQLTESEARCHAVIESAMDAIITVDESQRIVQFNGAAETVFGYPAKEMLGKPLGTLVPKRFRRAHRQHIHRFAATGVTMRRMGAASVLHGLRASGEEFPIDASISQVRIDGRKYFNVILRDVTERERAAAALRRERDTAQRYLDIAGVILVVLNSKGQVTLINRKGCEVLGYREEEIIGQSWIDRFLPESQRRATWKVFRRMLAGEVQLTERHENPVLTRSGAERIIAWQNRTLTDESGRIIGTLSSGADVTERRRAEQALERSHEELRGLYAAMHEVREAERTRIARELHDELAQWLTALKMDVSWLKGRLGADQQPLVAKTDKMRDLVDDMVAAVRRIAADLRPPMLDDLGLIATVENLVHDFSERTGVMVSLDFATGAVELRDPAATAIYRMVQEALTNVARHAGASELEVSMRTESGRLHVRVCDNGRGIETVRKGQKSFGVAGIRERARTLGGSAEIYSPSAGGTVVDIVIPAAPASAAGASG